MNAALKPSPHGHVDIGHLSDLLSAQQSGLPLITDCLADVIAAMEAQGYVVGEPVKHAPASLARHSEWHLCVSCSRWQCEIAFLLPGDAC